MTQPLTNVRDKPDIAPCFMPNCGGKCRVRMGKHWQVGCWACGYMSANYDTESAAIEAHNEISEYVRLGQNKMEKLHRKLARKL